MPRWRPLGFRFLASYLLLYVGSSFDLFEGLFRSVVPWLGSALQIDAPIRAPTNGSGDTLFHWLGVLVLLAAAPMLVAVWTLLDRAARHDATAREALRVLLRYTLAYFLMAYGSAKLTQFGPLTLKRLTEPFGEFSPMGVLWSFMSASPAYSLFAGAGEMTGALLLLFRRTATLGALVSMGVLANVVMLNFAYDVPVKLFSMHLLLFAVLVAAPDARRLANAFVLNRPVAPARIERTWPRPWMRRVAIAAKTLFIVGLVADGAQTLRRDLNARAHPRPKPPYYGIWEVDTFTVNGRALEPLLTDKMRWRTLVLTEFAVTLRRIDGEPTFFSIRPLEAENTFDLKPLSIYGVGESTVATLRYSRPSPERLELDGLFEGRTIEVRCHRLDDKSFSVLNRGFHWISEVPYNR